MYYPTTRLLTILELLQAHGRLGRADLAARLEVGERSVRRYIIMLQEMGIPVVGERGRYGGYRLLPGFKLPPLMFTEDEALALVLGLLAARRLGLADAAPAVEGALAKVDRVLPLALRERVKAVGETLVLDLRTAEAPPTSATVMALSTAARQGRRVRLRYRTRDRAETERAFDPYGVVFHAGLWYAAGHCHLRGATRVFRLDRVLDIAPSDDAATFTRPRGFDTLDVVRRALVSTPRAYTVVATLDTTLDEARRHLSPSFAALEETVDGVVLRCSTDSPEWLARVLAALGATSSCMSPPSCARRCGASPTGYARWLTPAPRSRRDHASDDEQTARCWSRCHDQARAYKAGRVTRFTVPLLCATE